MLALVSRFLIPPAVIFLALVIYRIAAVSAAIPIEHSQAIRTIVPTNTEPRVATDNQLRHVLARVVPPADPVNTNNFVHALRLWGANAKFGDPQIPSGEELRQYFLDDRVFRKWAGENAPPLFIQDADGVRARDYDENYDNRTTSSFHNDDLLATLAETGTSLDTPMKLRDGEATVEDLLRDSLQRFHVDRWEFEWSMLSYLRYRFPEREWTNKFGEKIQVGELIQMCVARKNEAPGSGPCHGQHRFEAIVVLLKIDEQVKVLSPANRQQLVNYLKSCSDRLVSSQSPEGYWTKNWVKGVADEEGAKAPANEKLLVTGHTLEWLALAPEEVLPPRENIVRAGQWIVNEIIGLDQQTLVDRYGPNSHAARALALWRGKEAWDLWQELEAAENTPSTSNPATQP